MISLPVAIQFFAVLFAACLVIAVLGRILDQEPKAPAAGLIGARDGEAVAAIKFALTLDDHFAMTMFLAAWHDGDLVALREFPEWLEIVDRLPPSPHWRGLAYAQ